MKTLRTFTRCLFLAFGLQAFSLSLPADNIYWDPGVTGTWFTPNGWREGSTTGALRGAPAAGDNAYIETGGITIGTGVSATNAVISVGQSAGSSGTLVIEAGGVDWTTGVGYIGYASGGSRGRAIVGGLMHIGSYLITGYSGTGHLDIASTGTVQALQYFNLGQSTSGRGFANVEGTLDVGSYMLLGRQGQGTMDVAPGGVVSISTYLDVGQSAGSVGLLNLAGSLSAGTYINIGNSGTGTLMLRDGGSVRVGTGTITLAQAATATGLLEIAGASAGAITGANGTSPVTITGGAGSARVLFSHSTANYTFANNLAGSLAVEVNGGGLTTLTGANNYTGGTIVRSGTLAGSTASIRGDSILVDGALLLDTPAAHNLTLTGTGAFNKLGAGSLTLTPASSFSGALGVSAGTLAFGAPSLPAGTPVTVSYNLSIAPAATAEMNTGAAALTWNGSFAAANATAAGALIKTGAGSLVFATPNLAFAGTLAVNQGSVTLAPGTTLGALSVGAGAAFSGGGSTVTGTLSLAHGSMLSFDLATPATTKLNVGGLLASGTTTIDFINLKNGAYTIISSSDSILAGMSNFTYTVNGATLTGRNSVDFTFGTNDISILASIYNLRVTWAGATGGIWDAASENWSAAGDNRFANGDSVRFGASASGTITIIPAGVTAGDIEVATTGTLTFVGGALTTSADSASFDGIPGLVSLGGTATDATTGKLVKKGAGTLVLANEAGTFAGGVEIEQGVLSFNNAAQLDTTGTNITFTGDAELRVDGNITGSTGAFSNAISIAGVNATFNTQSHTVEYTGALSSTGAAGALTKTGAGSLILRATDNSSFTAPVSVTAGSLLLADGAQLGSPLTVSAGASAGGDGAFTGDITINNGVLLAGAPFATPAGGTLNIGGALTLTGSARVDFGIHVGGLADTLNVTGAITTDTASNIVGLTFGHIDSGTYALGNATSLADIANLEVKGFLVDSTFRANYELAASAGTLFFIHEADDSRYMEWTGASGTTRWNIAQDNWRGYSDDTSGHLKFQDADTVRFSTTTATTIAIDAAVTVSDMLVDNTGTLTFTGQAINASPTVTGTLVTAPGGRLVKTGEGALVLNNAANTFIGGVEINAGLLAFSNTAQLGTAGAGIRFTGSGTLRTLAPMTISDTLTLAGTGFMPAFDTGDDDVTLSSALAGTGTLAKLGAGTLVITNSNTPATIGYHIAGGALQADAAVLKTSRVTTDTAGTLILVQETSVSYTPAISGPGAFEKRGSGVLTLTSTLGNTGATRILEGELRPGANNRLN
ncbi:beta strand repeat-containing protein, partial [Termitidicoccus mucosus]